VILESPFKGVNFQLRSVNEGDSSEILQLRLNGSINQYIHKTSPELHNCWLNEQISKVGDYYFVIECVHDSSTHGFIGLYDVTNNSAEWGRWILKPGSSAAMESYWLILKFGFEMGLSQIYSRTDSRNLKVNSIHDSLPFSKVENVSENFGGLTYVMHTLNLSDWKGFEEKLMKYIRRRPA
jgi:RimJ/RimL family protein N-acetyltransferase